ncbi:MAG: hypothetical protein K6G60_07150 [Lachnospiraceae bacterium]|nr:hypothetical protein [Lachnospiraceae bacterium]
MKVVYKGLIKGDGLENEDICDSCGNVFWVIDGATDLFGLNLFSTVDDVAYYVKHLNENIKKHCYENAELSDIIKESVVDTNRELLLSINYTETYKLPCFAIAMARIQNNVFDYYVLGDCTIAIRDEEGVRKITDDRIGTFSKKNVGQLSQLIQNGEYSKEREIEIYRLTRSCMNKKDGYWIGSCDPVGIVHGVSGKLAINKKTSYLAYTDGLAEAFEVFEIYTIDKLKFQKEEIDYVLSKLINIRSYDTGRAYTRVRQQDDIAFVLVEG